MIKLIIFDLDGVLIATKNIHFESLNKAIEDISGKQYIINKQEHIAHYDGLSTMKKLAILTKDKGLPKESHGAINALKQTCTMEMLREKIQFSPEIFKIIERLYTNRFILHVASNAVTQTIETVLDRLQVRQYISHIESNQRCKQPKPNPEMYLRCMIEAGVGPEETMVIEDSYVGRQGAYASGALVFPVNSPKELDYQAICRAAETHIVKRAPWVDKKLNVLIPMAGAGSRFTKEGFTFPKPLIPVLSGKPMISVVVESLNIDAHYIFIVRKEHLEKYNIETMLKLIAPDSEMVVAQELTEGAACTTLLAKDLINNDHPVFIVNSDQYIEWDSWAFMYAMQHCDGGILTFYNVHPQWSYAKVDKDGWITEVKEKEPISTNATVGAYYLNRGRDYVKYAEQMIAANKRVNNEFYVCPVWGEAIADGKKIKNWPVDRMIGMGTPEQLRAFQTIMEGKI